MLRYGRQCEKEVSVDEVDSLQCSDKRKAPEKCEDYISSTTTVTATAGTTTLN